MRLAASHSSLVEIRTSIKERFAEFNRLTPARHGRRYPEELRELIRKGSVAGIEVRELVELSGMSVKGVNLAIGKRKKSYAKITGNGAKHSGKPSPKRLDVFSERVESSQSRCPLVIRLPSGIVIETTEGSSLTPSLLQVLAKVEVSCVASR